MVGIVSEEGEPAETWNSGVLGAFGQSCSLRRPLHSRSSRSILSRPSAFGTLRLVRCCVQDSELGKAKLEMNCCFDHSHRRIAIDDVGRGKSADFTVVEVIVGRFRKLQAQTDQLGCPGTKSFLGRVPPQSNFQALLAASPLPSNQRGIYRR